MTVEKIRQQLSQAKPDNFPQKATIDDLLFAMRESEVLKLTNPDYQKGFRDALDIIVRWKAQHEREGAKTNE